MQFFQQRRLSKLRQSILDGDIMAVKKQLKKLASDNEETLVLDTDSGNISPQELAIRSNQPQVLEHLLQAGFTANNTDSQQQPLLYLALQQEQSLALITVLLQAGAVTEPGNLSGQLPETALLACFKYQVSPLTLHISRLAEQGANLQHTDKQGNNLLHQALQLEDQNLIQLLISSDLSMVDLSPETYSPAIFAYAKRCAEDLRVRRLMMG
ncbi:hypothetical protein [Aliamphritea ceti]|uniref:hypothetical protein n=1 Tax=Aliamphritea ceti TaxID=1524258 RepID=UPI0021C486CC|nr:hypothetical protein [Aliamphritea ceti]